MPPTWGLPGPASIRSYIDTARKHGKNAIDVLHDLLLGTPWQPPA
jgi:hypothetical protein